MPTKRGNGEGSIRKVTKIDKTSGKKREYWEGRYSVPNPSGKQIRKSVYGQTRKEVADKISQITSEISAGTFVAPSDITVSQWFDIWLKDYCSDKKYLTVKSYTATVNNHIKPYFGGKLKLSELKPLHIQQFYNALSETNASGKQNSGAGKKAKPISAKTIKNIHGVMTVALNTAVDQEIIAKNPASKAIVPKTTRPEIVPLTDEQVKQFLNAVTGDEYEMPLKLILFTGLRESEAIGLTWDCVDFKNSTIKICKQLQRRDSLDGGYTFAPLKNNKTRTIVCSPFVMKLLKDREKQQIAERMAAGEFWQGFQSEKERKSSLVFTKPDGNNVNVTMMYRHYKKVAEKIGCPESRVHDLRHTYAVLSLQNGDDVKTVQSNLGHATASFTLDVYGHASDVMKQSSADRMQKYIESISKMA